MSKYNWYVSDCTIIKEKDGLYLYWYWHEQSWCKWEFMYINHSINYTETAFNYYLNNNLTSIKEYLEDIE